MRTPENRTHQLPLSIGGMKSISRAGRIWSDKTTESSSSLLKIRPWIGSWSLVCNFEMLRLFEERTLQSGGARSAMGAIRRWLISPYTFRLQGIQSTLSAIRRVFMWLGVQRQDSPYYLFFFSIEASWPQSRGILLASGPIIRYLMNMKSTWYSAISIHKGDYFLLLKMQFGEEMNLSVCLIMARTKGSNSIILSMNRT